MYLLSKNDNASTMVVIYLTDQPRLMLLVDTANLIDKPTVMSLIDHG